jgi:FkbM family methyltransferase
MNDGVFHFAGNSGSKGIPCRNCGPPKNAYNESNVNLNLAVTINTNTLKFIFVVLEYVKQKNLTRKSKLMKFKNFLRYTYRRLPLKRPFLHLLRSIGVGAYFSNSLKGHLVFEGDFKVQLAKEKSSFRINNGYGRQIEAACFWNGIEAFERSTIDLWRQLARDAHVIVDVGANTGIYSLVAKAVNSQANVYAFEPIKRVYQILESNVALNAESWYDSPEIRTIQVALSDYDGTGEMFDLPVEHMYTASLNKDIHLERGNKMLSVTEIVKVQRLETFCASHAVIPDLIKIDVESHEPSVLRGMGDLLKRHQPIFICEIWNNTVGEAVEAALNGCGYSFVAIGDTLTKTTHIRNDEPEKGYINYLLASDRLLHGLSIE